MTDWLAQHCRFSEEYNAAYRIFSSATVGSQRKASLRYCPGQTTTILISGFSFARSKKRAEDLRRRSSALGAGDRTRTGTVSPPADFESATSTIPSHRHIFIEKLPKILIGENKERTHYKSYILLYLGSLEKSRFLSDFILPDLLAFEWLYRFCFPQQSALHRSLEALILLAFLIFSRFY